MNIYIKSRNARRFAAFALSISYVTMSGTTSGAVISNNVVFNNNWQPTFTIGNTNGDYEVKNAFGRTGMNNNIIETDRYEGNLRAYSYVDTDFSVSSQANTSTSATRQFTLSNSPFGWNTTLAGQLRGYLTTNNLGSGTHPTAYVATNANIFKNSTSLIHIGTSATARDGGEVNVNSDYDQNSSRVLGNGTYVIQGDISTSAGIDRCRTCVGPDAEARFLSGVLDDGYTISVTAQKMSSLSLSNFDTRSFDTSLFKTNGSASFTGNVLQLTPDEPGQRGSAFLASPLNISANNDVHSFFEFQMGGKNSDGPLGSDGLAFVIQNDPRGNSAIGNGGEGMGFGTSQFQPNTPPISPSIAIAFDTHGNAFDPSGNHIEFIENGNVAHHGDFFSPSFSLNNGTSRFVWIDYSEQNKLLEVFLSDTATKPTTASLTEALDLHSQLGSQAYFGFSAGTGGGYNYHDILQWKLSVPAIPEPQTYAMLLAGLGLVFFVTRQRITS